MTEFLTENARRAYPLGREWPAGMEAWSRTLLDASVSTTAVLGDERLSLLSVQRAGADRLVFNVGIPGLESLPVVFDRTTASGRTAVAYAGRYVGGAALPYKARLEYIESDGSQYIDTGIVLSSDCRVVCDWMPVTPVGTSSAYPFGIYGNNKHFGLNIGWGGTFYVVWASVNTGGQWHGGFGTRYVHDMSAAGVYQNGVLRYSPSGTFTGTVSAYLFWAHGTGQAKPNVRIYSAQFYDGEGNMTASYIPVLDNNDVACMYDEVTGAFFYNKGSGSFSYDASTAVPAVAPDAVGLKALLTVDVAAANAILASGHAGGNVNVPFALRCATSANRRVTAISAYGTPERETALFGNDAEPVSVVESGHATMVAKDGVDLEVTGMAPLAGDVLRVSAIAAPEAVEETEDPIDLMIRGDECFIVETIPGAKVSSSGTVVAREEADGDGGVVRIGTACKPCCQCEDYKDAVDMLRPAETKAVALEGELDEIKDAYESALAAFASAKQAAEAAVNSLDNVRLAISTAGSSAVYTGSTAEGTRQRFTATLLVENLTMVQAVVSNLSIPAPTGYAAVKTVQSGSLALQPGAMLVVVTTFRTTALVASNALDSPPAVHASCTVTLYKPDGTTPSGTKSI